MRASESCETKQLFTIFHRAQVAGALGSVCLSSGRVSVRACTRAAGIAHAAGASELGVSK